MNISEITAQATALTVINDGQVQYPVRTADLAAWVAAKGPITAANYEQFCSEVDCIGEKLGTPGSVAIVSLCESLIEAGADSERLG